MQAMIGSMVPGAFPPRGPGGFSYRELQTMPMHPVTYTQSSLPPRLDSFSDRPGNGPSCCGLDTNCLDAGQIAEQQWTHVGEGRGTHQFAPTYIYAGEGAGSWIREEKFFPNQHRNNCLWVLAGLCCCLLVLVPIVVLLIDHGGDLMGTAQHVHKRVSDHLGNAADHVNNGVSTIAGHVSNAAQAVHSAVKENAPGVLDGLKTHAGKAAEAVNGAVKEHAPGLLEKAKNGAQTVASHAGNAAKAAHDAAKEHGPRVVEHVQNGLKSLADQAGQPAQAGQADQAR